MFKTKNLSIISQYLFDLIDLARSLQASLGIVWKKTYGSFVFLTKISDKQMRTQFENSLQEGSHRRHVTRVQIWINFHPAFIMFELFFLKMI